MDNVSAETLSLELSRHFDAPPERVFDAWTGVRWGEWLPPRGARCEVTAIDPRVGGSFTARMTMPDGRTIEITGAYREVVRPDRLAFTWSGDCGPETTVTLTFRPEGGGTLMTLRQDGFPPDGLREGYREGWGGEGGSFDKLAALLARG